MAISSEDSLHKKMTKLFIGGGDVIIDLLLCMSSPGLHKWSNSKLKSTEINMYRQYPFEMHVIRR